MPIVKRQDKRNSGYNWYAYRCKITGDEYRGMSGYASWRKKADHAYYLYTKLTEHLGTGIPFELSKVYADENNDRIPRWAFETVRSEMVFYFRSLDEAEVAEKLLTVLALTSVDK